MALNHHENWSFYFWALKSFVLPATAEALDYTASQHTFDCPEKEARPNRYEVGQKKAHKR